MKTAAPVSGESHDAPHHASDGTYPNYSESQDADDDGIGLFDVLALVRRRRQIIIAITAIGTGLAALYGFSRTPIYTAEAQLLIEPESRVIDFDSVVAGVSPDAAAIETEINLLRSSHFLTELARRLYAVELSTALPEDVAGVGVEVLGLRLPTSIVVASGWAQEPALISDEEAEQLAAEAKAAQLNGNLEIAQKGRSFIISIAYTSPRRPEAARVANALAELYIEDQTTRRRAVTGQATDFLVQRLAELENELRDAEEAVQGYRAEHALTESSGFDVNSQQMSDLTGLLVNARASRKEKETRLRYIGDLQRHGEGLETLSEVLESPYVVQLWERDSELSRQQAELRSDLGQNHPIILNLKAEQEEVALRITAETARIVANMKNELDVLIEREKSIQGDIEGLVAKTDHADRAGIELRRLEREATASRQIYENFLLRVKETREQEAVVQPNTRIIASAKVPTVPTGRGPISFVIGGLVASSMLAGGMAFLRDKTDHALRSGKEVERVLGLPCFGLVPFIRERERQGRTLHQYLLARPLSIYAETIRSVHTNLKLSNVERKRQVVQITSSLPGEGKTSFAVSLATSLAVDGYKALLIDLDLRHPSVGREIDLGNATCLVDFLQGEQPIDQVMMREQEAGFHVLGVRSPTEHPGRLIDSKRLKRLLEALRQHYDYIIVDSTPTLGLSDGKTTIALVDVVLFIVHWDKIPADSAADAVKELRHCRAELAGAVVTQVDLAGHARYGYGGVDSAYGQYQDYYKN